MTVEKMVEELWAKEQIRQGIYNYTRSMDHIDKELGHSVFWPEAKGDYGIWFQGTCWEFVDWTIGYHSNEALATFHQMTNISVTVNGDKAGSETYGLVVLRHPKEEGKQDEYVVRGRYIDQWECRQGQWKISDRRYVIDMADRREVTRYDTPFGGSRHPDDLSYEVLK